ncbi:deoxyribonuclease TatD [Aspergillus sclerotioniger CBS 115572]|uniref:Deoxyribonuclease TatD n=1 Tax=Aspergillus sclerotioniger CBS 115572 TaxID=1450535 RepID=A0A317V145_9EURO|nr:deoxyribonuclease TatD [Aspergillus sclerotioniger CBS 115572]PWY67111.1 deoxyribonuclease TatD [Aspergillus sclerotioniger CBS 115572]
MSPLRFADVAVTYTAPQFHGIYRGKQYHAPDFSEVITRAKTHNCEKMMLTSMNLEGFHTNLSLVREFPEICSLTLGVHPYHVKEIYSPDGEGDGKEYLAQLREVGQRVLQEGDGGSPLVAFGEIGLDYEYLERADKEIQIRAFREQLEIAVEMQLPLFLHVRESCADFVEIVSEYLPRLPKKGLVHSFTGSREEMIQLVGMGLDISVNGVSFRTDAGLDMVRAIPLERLQLETDAPWCEVLGGDERISGYLRGARELPGVRKHNKFILGQMIKGRNESCYMERVALVVAGVKGVEVEVVARAAWENSVKMFGLGVKE